MFRRGFEAYGRGRIRSLERQLVDIDIDIQRLERRLSETPFENQIRRKRIKAKLARRRSKEAAMSRSLAVWKRVLEDPYDGGRE
jgi:hypothetical protein